MVGDSRRYGHAVVVRKAKLRPQGIMSGLNVVASSTGLLTPTP